jgi:hypothetical protein
MMSGGRSKIRYSSWNRQRWGQRSNPSVSAFADADGIGCPNRLQQATIVSHHLLDECGVKIKIENE